MSRKSEQQIGRDRKEQRKNIENCKKEKKKHQVAYKRRSNGITDL